MAKKPDYVLMGTVIFLVILGIIVLSSTSFSLSQEKFDNPFRLFTHQVVYGLIPGFFAAWICYKIPLERFRKMVVPLFIINLVLMVMVFVPGIGIEMKGASRWVSFGLFSFQPSEFLKLSFILYLASWLGVELSSMKEKKPRPRNKFSNDSPFNIYQNRTRNIIAFCSITGFISLFLILQPDISTLGIIIIIALLMYFVAGAPFWHVGLIISFGVAALLALIKIAPYRMERFLVFLNPELYPAESYHIQQALIAVGSGGIKGMGLGLSRQRFGFLPETISDSIFPVFAEETGFIGSFLLILLLFILLFEGFKIAKNAKDDFLKLTAFGITSWLVIQSFANIGSMIKVIPLLGIPLPFISYGGSAIMVELIGVGILLNISKNT